MQHGQVAVKPPSGVDYKRIILACMADYLDAGAIVAASLGLALWQDSFGISNAALGLLSAIGVNAGSYAVGSLVGGRLGDYFGRKRIYKWDLLLYILGGLFVVFAGNAPMLFVGLVILGLAVGADVPTSWAIIGEIAPPNSRGRFIGLTSVFWGLGPLVSLGLGVVVAPLGVDGIRIVFGQLVLVAFVTWYLRRNLAESEIWTAARKSAGSKSELQIRRLLRAPYAGSFVLILVVHTFGAIINGTFGFFLPYILKTFGTESQAASAGFNAINWVLNILGVALLFMRLVDRVNRRLMYGVAGAFNIAALTMLIVFPVTNQQVVIIFIAVFAISGSCGQEQLYRVWCQELFPTMLRTTAQGGIMFTQKIALAVWSIFVPSLAAWSFSGFISMLAVAGLVSVLAGVIFMPKKPARLEGV